MIVDVMDQSQVAAARRAAVDLARGQGADAETAGKVAIIASEMASNLLKHAPGGQISAGTYADSTGSGVELIALDKGKGIADAARAMTDGYSTAGTQGSGLGAIQRQADDFAMFTRANQGTAILARIKLKPFQADPIYPGAVIIGAVHAPFPGEHVSGDGWSFATAQGPTLLVIDGTGHGPLAADAAATAIGIFRENAGESCTRLMEMIHRALMPTRGGAVAIARFDAAAKAVRYVGVGNISGALITGQGVKRMVSNNGIAGGINPRIREFTYEYAGPAVAVLHSDGLSAKWDMNDYPGLAYSHPSLIAGVLFRDFWRARDDGLVVALKAA